MLWPRGLSSGAIVALSFQQHFATRHMPLSTLGHGAASEVRKGVALCHGVLLEAGSMEAFERYRNEVRGYCSDQGTEAALADGGCALSPACDLTQWAAQVAAACRGEVTPIPGSYLLPRALFVPDHLHMIFGALEHAVKGTHAWAQLETHLRVLSRFLRNAGYKARFIETCVDDPSERAVVKKHTKELTDWKWEYVGQFLLDVRGVLPVLRARFSVAKFSSGFEADGADERLSKADAALVQDLAAALADERFVGLCEILRCVCFACDRQATRLEGCRCHEGVLSGDGSWPSRVRRYRLASAQCVWKGRRAVELSLGYADKMLNAIGSATDQHAREAMASAPPQARQEMLLLEQGLVAAIRERLERKLRFWRSLPYSLLGMAGCVLGVCALCQSKVVASKCLEEFDDAVRRGLLHKLHRVAVLFLGEAGALRSQVLAFSLGPEPLEAFPQLHAELLSYAFVPCVSRRVEAVHSGIQGFKRKAMHHSMPWLAAKIRRKDTVAALQTSDFQSWLTEHWNDRDVLRRSLRCMFSRTALACMSVRDVFGWWYQSGHEAQFRDIKEQSVALRAWGVVAKANAKPEAAPVGDGEALLVQFVKSVCVELDVWWSVPKGVLDTALATPDSADLALVVALEQKQMTPLEVGSRICSMVGELDGPVVAYRPAAMLNMVFFKVLDAHPERKKVVQSSHLEISRTELGVFVCDSPAISPEGLPTFDASAGRHAALDLGRVDLLLLLRVMSRWALRDLPPPAVGLPRAAATELAVLDDLSASARTVVDARVGPRVLGRGPTETAEEVLRELDARHAYAHLDSFILVDALACQSSDVIKILCAHKVVIKRTTLFGDAEVALLADGVVHQQGVVLDEHTPILGMPCHTDLSSASKLQLLVQLVREGWHARGLALEPYLPGSAREVSLNMLLRSKRYFEALVDAERLFARGAPRICHNMPEGYYTCLFELNDLVSLHARPDLLTMGNRHFRELLAGREPEVAPLRALADEQLEADEADEAEGQPDAGVGSEPPPAAIVSAMPAAMAIGLPDLNDELRPIMFGAYTARFDRWSHSSGVLRCYIKCANPEHRSCFRYMQMNQYPTRNAVLARLFAWAELGAEGSGMQRNAHQSRQLSGDPARIAEIEACLP